MVIAWDRAGMMVSRICGWTVCQSAPQRDACVFVCLIQQLFFCLFPSGASQIVSARQQLYSMFPRGSPNIQGIRRHLACKSLFLCLTLCIAFYFPLSCSLSILAASQLYKQSISFVSLWLHIRWSHSSILSPASSPPSPSYWSVFNLYSLIGHWYITEYSAEQ